MSDARRMLSLERELYALKRRMMRLGGLAAAGGAAAGSETRPYCVVVDAGTISCYGRRYVINGVEIDVADNASLAAAAGNGEVYIEFNDAYSPTTGSFKWAAATPSNSSTNPFWKYLHVATRTSAVITNHHPEVAWNVARPA